MAQRHVRTRRHRLLLPAVAAVGLLLIAACGEDAQQAEASAVLVAAEFDRTAYAEAIAGDNPPVSARLESPTNDGNGDIRVEVDRRPADSTTRLSVSITRGAEQVAFELLEVADQVYFLDSAPSAEAEWITTTRSATGGDIPHVEELVRAFPVVGDVVGSVRARGWTHGGAEPCPGTGACFVLTNPAFEFASLFVDVRTHRPVHLRLARPGMRAAGEIEIDWLATGLVNPPADARRVNAAEFQSALAPVLRTLGL